MGAAGLTVTVSGSGTGTVTSSPAGITCPSTCTGTFAGNSAVVLTATAGTGSTFTSFSGNCTPASPQTTPPSCTVTMSADETVTATFGTAPGGTITIAPTTLLFGDEGVGTTAVSQTLTVSNTGGTPVTFTNIVTSGDFAGATLAQCPSIAVEANAVHVPDYVHADGGGSANGDDHIHGQRYGKPANGNTDMVRALRE